MSSLPRVKAKRPWRTRALYLGPLRLSALDLDYGQPGARVFGWCLRAIWAPEFWSSWGAAWGRSPTPHPKDK